MARITVIDSLEELSGLRLVWQSLLAQTRQAGFFQSLDWLEPYWRHHGQGQRLRVLVARAGGETLGILPLVVRSERSRLGAMRVLTYPLHDWGAFYGPIGPQPTATLVAGLQYLRGARRDWDLLDLRWVDREGRDQGRTAHSLAYCGFPAQERAWDRTAVVDFAGSWDDYWHDRGGRRRRDVTSCERKLARLGGVRYVRYRPLGAVHGQGDPRWDLYDACEGLSRLSWQADSATGATLCHASIRAYLRDAHVAAAHAGGLDLNLLYVQDRPAAFIYGYQYAGEVFALRAGYDPALASRGVGTALMRRVVQDGFERGDRRFDLGPGSLAWKRHWLTSIETSFSYAYYPPLAPRAQALRLKRSLSGWRWRSGVAPLSLSP